MKEKEIYHLNDRTMKYMTLAQTKRQHQYLGLPGEFKTRLPQEIVFPNLDFGRADEYYLNDEGLLINLEEESGDITNKTLDKFAKYVIFASYRYNGKVYLMVICHKDPKKDFEYYRYSPSLYIKVHYFFISQEEFWVKYENVISKVKQKEELTEMEALDIAFISKFISKENAPQVIETLTKVFKHAKIEDKLLKMDVGVILGGMILKHYEGIEKQTKLMGMINMRHIEREIDKLVYDEYGDILDKKDEEIEAKEEEIKTQAKEINSKNEEINSKNEEINSKNEEINSKNNEINELNKSNREYKDKIKQLSELSDLNSPEAKKIINSLMLL